MPFYRTIKLFLFLFLCFTRLSSQNFPVRNYTAANELPNNSVRALHLDSNNILWIGTDNGVVKKENDDFRSLFEEDGLALNSCWAIAEDKNKKLWFGSYGKGISIYDGFRFKVISTKEGLIHNEITELFAHGKNMFVGTSDGISIVDINSLNVISPEIPSGKELFRVQDFFEYNGQIYVGSYRSGIYKIQLENDQVSLEKVNDHEYSYSIFIDNGEIYNSHKGFYTKSPLPDYLSNNFSPVNKLGTSIIWDHVKTADGRIFAAAWGIYDTNGGIYELKDDKMMSRASEFDVASKEVLSLAYDPGFKRLYIGTKDSGLFEVALDPQIKFVETERKSILGFAETKNSSAVLQSGALLIKRAEDTLTITSQKLKKWQENFLSSVKITLPKHEDDFYELDYSTRAKNIKFYDLKVLGSTYWLNTNIGIFAIDESGNLERYLPLHSEEINFTPSGVLIETNPYGGVRVYRDLDAFTYTHYKQEKKNTPTMVVNSIRKAGKTYFLSVFSGLYVWENNGFRSYLQDSTWKEEKLRHITSLGKNLAISNEFGDVFIINDRKDFKVVQKIPRANIQGNTISFLKEYRGYLIIGTEKGLTLYKNGLSIFLDREQGLSQPLLSAKTENDTLLLGSNQGYYKIDLRALTNPKPLVDKIQLKEIFINNSEFSSEPVTGKKGLELAHNENTVLLKFSSNAHPYPDKLKYQYRLNPEDDWSLPSPKPEIFLPFLPANDYEIAVKVLDQSTGLSYSQPLLDLAILPPFWKTWWFILLLTALLVLAVFSFYQHQIMQTRKFEEQKGLIQKRFEETRMEALLAQMNPHFIFNAMNSIQYFIMENDIDNATMFLGDFAKLIRLNLDHCTQPKILLIEEIEYLQSYIRVENTRFNNAVKVEIDIDPNIDVYEVEIPTMLLQTFVENVFVHAFPPGVEDPALKISFELPEEGLLECRIQDNGIGFSGEDANKLHKSKGVSLVKERLALLGYNIEEAIKIESAKNRGTSVLLKLKI